MSLPRTKNVPLMFDLRRYSVTQAVLSGDGIGGAVEGQQKQPVMHLIAVALIVAETIDFAAGLRKQRSLAQLLVQVLGMEHPARLGPLDVVAVVADLKLGGLLAQGGHVLDQKTEGGVLIAALLGEVVVGQQALPQALANAIDRLQVDRAQAQALRQCRLRPGIRWPAGRGRT